MDNYRNDPLRRADAKIGVGFLRLLFFFSPSRWNPLQGRVGMNTKSKLPPLNVWDCSFL
jgi:hypothetical protein